MAADGQSSRRLEWAGACRQGEGDQESGGQADEARP
jgi:hypothetical protein